MPSHDPEIYRDKIEVSLDGRQIFYLFFGGSVIVGLVFVLGVMVGRRVEARGHLDRADTQAAGDPLAALDRLERSDHLSFHGALTGAAAPTEVERAIGELERRRTAGQEGKPDRPPPAAAPAGQPEKPERAASPAAGAEARAARPEDRPAPALVTEPADRSDTDRPRADRHGDDRRDGDRRDGDRRDGDRRDGDRRDGNGRDGDKKTRKHDDGGAGDARPDRSDPKKPPVRSEPATRPEARAEAKDAAAEPRSEPPDAREAREARQDGHEPREARSEGKSSAHADGKPGAKPDARAGEGKARFTLQLSSFQDRAEAEAFLGAMRSAGFQPYLIEADVTGKGTFYRVRLGSYRSLEAASDAKAEYERAARKTAQIMRL